MLTQEIIAGTEEKGDARVTVSPCADGVEIRLVKLPHPRFQEHVTALVKKVLREESVKTAYVQIEDFGALDFVLEARLRAALREAGKEVS